MSLSVLPRPVASVFTRAVGILALVLALLLPASRAAHACPAQIGAAAATPIGLEVANMTGMIYWWNYWTLDILDRLTRVANADSQNTQAENTANTGNIDKASVNATRLETAETRIGGVGEFIPSRVTCSVITQQQRTIATAAYRNTVRNRMSTTSTQASLNAPGSGTERGSIQALSTVWNNRCNNYFNAATTTLPAGITCPAPTNPQMVDLDITPWRSIFLPINIPGTPAGGPVPPIAQAAADTIRLLVEPIPGDPVRGVALQRVEAQNIHVLRMRDLARMNLARGALEEIVATRTSPLTPDPVDGRQNSRLARYIEMISGQNVTGNNVSGQLNSIVSAGEMQNANVQTIAARMQSHKMILSEFLRYTEQMLAIEAAKLGIKIEETSSAGTGVGARVLQRQ